MITKYFTKVSVKFNPFSASAKPVRLFLARIPAQQKSGCSVDFKILENPADKALVKVTFKDKQSMEIDPKNLTFKDLSSHFDTHSRKLALKEALSN
ncbi:hypothetical protein METBIDRAFT_40396 [Metschnikowia bicuspidata var. bicuspidata NRRL YB-4993]|uniref:Large ribosomal subunit protein mL53 n=1 Tax=Metschnikowia bicuspidata var. bicuspidata NRRL YB-4993 TaxID=869754 RepID=A0A1A0HEX6_9ASCO|nr:hypothetical protein METBIDRAFT_40396 [Metschnikowia bicuspidata var. bicuspidata NRRL YB-4993]OBA22442.1 hypothetical protein METBIDRAFT_40396 [Metschnikowia bicuspidata var. bicuspidata NRRL YB-4993]